MAKSEKIRLGLVQPSGAPKEKRTFERSASWWHEAVRIAAVVVQLGGAFSLYTSRDGSATGLAIKAGKDRKVYWFGPDDDMWDKFDEMAMDWALTFGESPLKEEIEAFAVQIAQDREDGYGER